MKVIFCSVAVLVGVLLGPSAFGLMCGDLVSRDVVLTEDLLDCPAEGLRIDYSNNVTIDLNGYRITGKPGSDSGVMIVGSTGSRVINGSISGFTSGVAGNYASELEVADLHLSDLEVGIYFLEVTSSRVHGNYFEQNFSGVSMDSAGSKGRNEIQYNYFVKNTQGIFIRDSSHNQILSNSFRFNGTAVGFAGASKNEVSGNGIFDGNSGISIQANSYGVASSSNLVRDNKLYGNDTGLMLYAPNANPRWNKYNRIERNAFRGGVVGVEIFGSRNYRTSVAENSFYDQSSQAVEDSGTRTELDSNRCGFGAGC